MRRRPRRIRVATMIHYFPDTRAFALRLARDYARGRPKMHRFGF